MSTCCVGVVCLLTSLHCVGEVQYSSLFVCVQKFTLFFLNMVITTAIKFYMQLVTVVSYHFTFIDGKPLKIKLAGKNTALRKFHISVHLMTPVDRVGIISKKYVGISILHLC